MMMTILNIFSNLNIKHIYVLLLVLIYSVGSFFVYRKIFSDPELKKFFLDSLRESNTGKASGKSLTAFLLSNIIGFATIIAVIYAPHHLLPEYFLISILTFVASLYGISMASKYVSGGSNSGSTANQQQTSPQSVTVTDATTENKKEEVKKEESDIG